MLSVRETKLGKYVGPDPPQYAADRLNRATLTPTFDPDPDL